MEILLLTLLLSTLLLVAPAKPGRMQGLVPPPAIRRHVDIAELQGASLRLQSDAAPPPTCTRMRPVSPGPTIEDDGIEELVCEGQQVMVVARGQMLLLRRTEKK